MRKAQITIFVLIGTLVILGVAASIYLSQGVSSEARQNQVEEQQEATTYDEAVTPIAEKLRTCASDLTAERVKELAGRGGYTEEEVEEFRSGLQRQTYRQEAVDYYGDGALIVPYWYHSRDSPDCTTCTLTSEIPSLTGPNSFKSKTESYVKNNLRECVNDFRPYNASFDITTGDIAVDVTFNKRDTRTTVAWPLSIDSYADDTTYSINTTTTQIDLPMRKLYEAAQSTVTALATDNIPAKYAKKIVTFNSFNNEIPPVEGGTTIGRQNEIWMLSDVKENIRQGFSSYASLIEVIGPNEPLPGYETYDTAQFASDLVGVSSNEVLDHYNVEASFLPTWPITVRINGEANPIISPDSYGFNVQFFSASFSDQDFEYDVSYPLGLEVQDADALNGDGLTMRFAVEGNIRSSKPYDQSVTVADGGGTGSTTESVSFQGMGANKVNVKIDGPTSTTGNVQLECVGETIDAEDENPDTSIIETRLPTCTNGQLTYQASALQSETKNITITPGGKQRYTIETHDLQNVTVSIKRLPVFNKNDPSQALPYTPMAMPNVQVQSQSSGGISMPAFTLAQNFKPLQPKENITVLLTQINGSHIANFDLYDRETKETVELYPGEYDAQIFANYQLDDPITTEEEEICSGGVAGIGESCQTIPSETLPDIQTRAVQRCVQDEATEEAYGDFLNTTRQNPDTSALSLAQQAGYNVQNCVDQRLDQSDDLELLTGYYSTSNVTNITIPEGDDVSLSVPYFSYRPEQINTTRDMMIMGAVLDLPPRAKNADKALPKVNS